MKTIYKDQFNWWQKLLSVLLGLRSVDEDYVSLSWGYFAPKFGLTLMLNRGSYEDASYSLSVCLGWGYLNINLPFTTSIGESCDPPRYGVTLCGNTLMLYLGGKMNEFNQCDSVLHTWDIPFVSYNHEGWFVKDPNGVWVDKTILSEDGLKSLKEVTDFTYVTSSGNTQHRKATHHLQKGIWHRKWFPFLKIVEVSLEVEFDEGTGDREEYSWKGGVIMMSCELNKGETPLERLKRLEKDPTL